MSVHVAREYRPALVRVCEIPFKLLAADNFGELQLKTK